MEAEADSGRWRKTEGRETRGMRCGETLERDDGSTRMDKEGPDGVWGVF